MRHWSFTTTAIVFLLNAAPVIACPLCETGTGQQVREGIFNNEFGNTFLAMILPFLAMTVFVAWIHGGPLRTASTMSDSQKSGHERPADQDDDRRF